MFDDASDYYPDRAVREEMEGVARVRVALDPSGSPVRCTILVSSGHPLLDRQTCKVVGTDPAFTSPGKPSSSGDLSRTVVQSVAWRLPEA